MGIAYTDLREGDRLVIYYANSRYDEFVVRTANGSDLDLESAVGRTRVLVRESSCAPISASEKVKIKNYGNRGVIGRGNHVRIEFRPRDVYSVERERNGKINVLFQRQPSWREIYSGRVPRNRAS